MGVMRVAVMAVGVAVAAVAGCGPVRQDGDAAPAGAARGSGGAPAAATPTGAAASASAGRSTPADTGGAASASAGRSSPADAGGAAAPGPCRTGQLRGDIEQFEPPGQAGSEQDAWLSLFNTGPRCTLSGFVGLQLLTADGQPRETRVTRSPDKPARVVLATGDTAWTLLVWSFMPHPDEADTEPLCGPKADAVQVTPPNQSDGLRIVENIRVICNHGEIFLRPLTATRPTLGGR